MWWWCGYSYVLGGTVVVCGGGEGDVCVCVLCVGCVCVVVVVGV